MKKIFQSRIVSEFGTLLVLLLLFAYFTVATWRVIHPVTDKAAREVAEKISSQNSSAKVLIAIRGGDDEQPFAKELKTRLEQAGCHVIEVKSGSPLDYSETLRELGEQNQIVHFIAATYEASANGVLRPKPGSAGDHTLPGLQQRHPSLADATVIVPDSYDWSQFLTRGNVLNIANHISYTAIIAIGMTLVIITAGIDLSVGSLMAFAAVTTAWMIEHWGGATDATAIGMICCCLGGLGLCGLFGAFSGVMITAFRLPAFICTLGVMMIARGLAHTIAPRENISVDATGFDWLGSQSTLLGVPNPVMLMILLFIGAHILMTRTTLGRYIYAVGGNAEAARLSGVPVKWVLIFVYALCGLLAGVAGIINASLFGNGNPRFGEGEELQVIAAVVVGGTSLAGGEGRILGTLIGALIIAVIYSGMNQTGVGEHMQKVVFGLLILAAVLLDQLKKRGLKQAD
ncbi:MAG: ABC transporter permease [Verrucomicrobiia bacterium]